MVLEQLFMDFAKAYGLPLTMLLLALITGARGIWVFGREFRALQKDRDDWKLLALEGTLHVSRAVKLAEQRKDRETE